MCLEIVLPIELEQIFVPQFRMTPSISLKKRVGIGGLKL